MGSATAKQMLTIDGATVLEHTLRRIIGLPGVQHVVIPADPALSDRIRRIIHNVRRDPGCATRAEVEWVPGGKERMHSVAEGLQVLRKHGTDLVIVHDAVRPCFPVAPALQAIKVAAEKGAAILAVPVRDTVKTVDAEFRVTSTPDRKTLWLAQTPQVFRTELLAEAYEKALREDFPATDDASVAERAGYTVHVVEGSPDNIKITWPPDLLFAADWLRRNSHKMEQKRE